jgi:hypothetical protein
LVAGVAFVALAAILVGIAVKGFNKRETTRGPRMASVDGLDDSYCEESMDDSSPKSESEKQVAAPSRSGTAVSCGSGITQAKASVVYSMRQPTFVQPNGLTRVTSHGSYTPASSTTSFNSNRSSFSNPAGPIVTGVSGSRVITSMPAGPVSPSSARSSARGVE